MSHQTPDLAHPQGFASTRWSLVLAAGRGDAPEADAALASLCQIYWYPLYAYVRRSGHPADEARDLTQEFFARLLEKHYLGAADSERGRFRSFLLTALKRFLSREWHRARSLKRGGGRRILSLDFEQGESRFRLEPATEVTAEAVYERRWALTMLDQVDGPAAGRVRAVGEAGRLRPPQGLPDRGGRAPRAIATSPPTLGMTEGAVKVAVHRLRRRFREAVLAEIAQTVAAPEEVDEELRHLFEAIRSRPS